MDSSYVLFHTLFTDFDISLFKTGKHYRLYNKMGAHPMVVDGVEGCYFSVYAPNAQKLYVVGDFNQWKQEGYTAAGMHPEYGRVSYLVLPSVPFINIKSIPIILEESE